MTTPIKSQQSQIELSINKLQRYMQSESYKGHDPYDVLRSPIFKWPLVRSRPSRFVFQQISKRIPYSLRGILQVPKGLNPVTLGLSLQAYSYLQHTLPNKTEELEEEIDRLKTSLLQIKSEGYSGICWGYDFDWEARYTTINAYVPTSVATGIITNGMFENFLLTGKKQFLEIARDACRFIMNDLKKSYDGTSFCYSYSPVDSQYVYNASMKAARLLAQVYSVDKTPKLLEESSTAVEYVVKNQKQDGSWSYSNHDARTWSDNYHTGYILDCLDSYINSTGDTRYQSNLEKGYHFYKDHFFEDSCIPKFYHNKTYPIDSTAAAQSLLTLSRFGDLELALKVATWYIDNMQDNSGGFYFRKHKRYTDRNIFMRWSNAWMLVGLSYLLFKMKESSLSNSDQLTSQPDGLNI